MNEFLKELLGDAYTEETTDEQVRELFNQRYVSAETHTAELSQANARADKLKAEKDKASSEAAEWKRKVKDQTTAGDEAKAAWEEAQKKQSEELAAVRRELELNKLTKKYMGIGYEEGLAAEQAAAFLDNDSDKFIANEKMQLDIAIKASQANALKNMPTPPATKPDDKPKEDDDPFLKGWRR